MEWGKANGNKQDSALLTSYYDRNEQWFRTTRLKLSYNSKGELRDLRGAHSDNAT